MLKSTKRIVSILLSALLLIVACAQVPFMQQGVFAQSGENLIGSYNPGFEEDWTRWNHSADDYIDTTQFNSGAKSLKLVGNVNNSAHKVSNTAAINVIEDQPLRIEFYSKTSLTAGECAVGIRYADDLGNTIFYDYYTIKPTSGWTWQGKTSIAPKNNFKLNPVKYTMKAYIYIYMLDNAQGSVWIDDIKVCADNLATDPGFELNSGSWTGNVTYETTASNVRTGTKSAKITGNTDSFNEFHSAPFITVDENRDVTLIANTKDTLAYNETFKIGVGFYNSSQTLISYSWQKTINRGYWTPTTLNAKSPAGTKYMKVFFWVGQNAVGSVWVDDVVCYSQNILLNPGFESGFSDWYQGAGTADTTTFHNGTKSAKMTGDPANSWNVMTYNYLLPQEPGDNFKLSAYIKNSLTAGSLQMGLRFVKEDRTTTIKYSLLTVPLSSNWNENDEVFSAPPETAYVTPYFILSQNAVGNVWIDDVVLSQVKDSLTFTVPDKKVYSMDSKIMTKFDIALSKDTLTDYKVRLERYDFGGTTPVFSKEYTSLDTSFSDYFNVSTLPMGYSIYKASLIRLSDSAVIHTAVQEVQKIDKYSFTAPADTSSVTIDVNKALKLNGTTPVIPRYMYHVDPYDYALFRDRGFTAVQTWGFNLDACQAAGLKGYVVLYHTGQVDIPFIQEQVTKYKNHPAVFAWLINDEPDAGNLPPESLAAAYDAIRAIDTSHPIVDNLAFEKAIVQGTFNSAMDIMSHDPYPIGSSGKVSYVSRRTDQQVATGKSVSSVMQAFGGYGYWTVPTGDQLRAMTYLALNHGAKSIGNYVNDDWSSGFFLRRDGSDMWSMYKLLNQEIETLTNVIAAADVAQNITSSSTALDIKVREYNGTRYLFAVNTTNNNVTATFTGAGLTAKTSAEVIYEYRTKDISGGSFTDSYSPYMVHIYRLVP